MSDAGVTFRLVCVCGKKLRIPANAAKGASKGKCPRCAASFRFDGGKWVAVGHKSEEQQKSDVLAEANAVYSSGRLPIEIPELPPALEKQEAKSPERDPQRITGIENDPCSEFAKPSELNRSRKTVVRLLEASNPSPDTDRSGLTTGVLRHDAIRESITDSLKLDDRYHPDNLAALALACHPWPDESIGKRLCDAISAELLPAFNLNHPSMVEIAIDRLLRFAEVTSFEAHPSLARRYFTAANSLLDPQDGKTRLPSSEAMTHLQRSTLASPLGVPTCISASPPHLQDNKEREGSSLGLDSQTLESLAKSLLVGAYTSGSRDIGSICGSESVDVNIDDLLKQLGMHLPEDAFDSHLQSISDRKYDVLKSRTYCLEEIQTLDAIKGRWSVTRERVRQIEMKAVEHIDRMFGNVFAPLVKQALQPYQSRVVKKCRLHDAAMKLAVKSKNREMLAAFLLKLFGPWKTSGEWCMHETIVGEVDALPRTLARDADQYGFVEAERLSSDCDGLFFSVEERDVYLTEVLGLDQSFGNWTLKSTMKCRAASAIKKIGRPATREELADLLDIDRNRVGSILGNIDGVVRADRYRWGFTEWIDDVYDGIVGEIEQRIDAYNGAVPVHVLVSEIPSQFGVAEGSVRAYLGSSAFVVENDMVRRADNENYVPRHPKTSKDAVRLGDCWAHRAMVYERHFNGYSLGVNFDIAYANGVRPGDDLVVPIEGSEFQASLIWRSHNLNRLVDVGRVSDYLNAEKFEAGDFVLIVPSRTGIRLLRDLQRDEISIANAEVEKTHKSDKLSDPLLDLLEG